jgi:hypothetical protein
MRTVLRALLAAIVTCIVIFSIYAMSRPDPTREAIDAILVNQLVYRHDLSEAARTGRVRDHSSDNVQAYLGYAKSLPMSSSEQRDALSRCLARSDQYTIIAEHLVPNSLAVRITAELSRHPR